MTSLRTSRRNLALLGIVLLGALAAVFLVMRYRGSEDTLLFWQEETAKAMRVVREASLTDIDALQQDLAQARADLEGFAFPPETQALQVTGLLAREAQEHGLSVGQITVARSPQKVGTGNYILFLYQVQVRGDPAGLAGLLEALEDSPWPTMVLEKVALELGKQGWGLSFEVGLFTQPRLAPGGPS